MVVEVQDAGEHSRRRVRWTFRTHFNLSGFDPASAASGTRRGGRLRGQNSAQRYGPEGPSRTDRQPDVWNSMLVEDLHWFRAGRQCFGDRAGKRRTCRVWRVMPWRSTRSGRARPGGRNEGRRLIQESDILFDFNWGMQMLGCKVLRVAAAAVGLAFGFVLASAVQPVQAAIYTWDAGGNGSQYDNNGTWSTSNANWWTGSGDISWTTSGTDSALRRGDRQLALHGHIGLERLRGRHRLQQPELHHRRRCGRSLQHPDRRQRHFGQRPGND